MEIERGAESPFETTPLDWRAAEAVHASSGGSGGVFFVSLPGNRRVAVKGSGEAAREVFATRVLRRLGVAAPACRTLLFGEEEYEALKERLAELSEGELRHRVLKVRARGQRESRGSHPTSR